MVLDGQGTTREPIAAGRPPREFDYRLVPPGPLRTAKDVGDLLRVPVRSVYTYVEQGLLPCHRVGKRVLRFSDADLAEFLRRSAGAKS